MIYVLIACLLLLHETAAYYAEGLVRFFPLDGNYDDMTESGYDLEVRYNQYYNVGDDYYENVLNDDKSRDKFTLDYAYDDIFNDQLLEGAIGFEESTPYPNGQSRKVLKLGYGAEFLEGSAAGLPEGNAPRTIMGWLQKTKDTVTSAPFFYGSTECNQAYYVFLPNSNQDQVHLNQLCKDNDEGVNSAAMTISNDKWYHVAFTYDGEKNSVYLDGEPVASGIPSVQPDTDTTSGVAFTAVGPYGMFQGYLADFAIFNRALSPEEVKAIYDSPNGIEVNPPSSCSCCEETLTEMKTIALNITRILKPPTPECTDKEGEFEFGFPVQKMKNWCAFIRGGKNDVTKKNRCNRPDDDGDTGLHTFCCEACKEVL